MAWNMEGSWVPGCWLVSVNLFRWQVLNLYTDQSNHARDLGLYGNFVLVTFPVLFCQSETSFFTGHNEGNFLFFTRVLPQESKLEAILEQTKNSQNLIFFQLLELNENKPRICKQRKSTALGALQGATIKLDDKKKEPNKNSNIACLFHFDCCESCTHTKNKQLQEDSTGKSSFSFCFSVLVMSLAEIGDFSNFSSNSFFPQIQVPIRPKQPKTKVYLLSNQTNELVSKYQTCVCKCTHSIRSNWSVWPIENPGFG